MNDRIQWDGPELDEIVVSDAFVHIERMSHHGWWMSVTTKTGQRIALNMADAYVSDEEGHGLPVIDRGPLRRYCDMRWTHTGREHQCDAMSNHDRHRCECGATKRASR